MKFRLTRTRLFLLLGLLGLVVVYWLLPIPGQVLLAPDNWRQINAWPQVRLDAETIQPGEEASLTVFDTVPWPYVKLVVGEGEGTLEGYRFNNDSGVYRWNWTFTAPDAPDYSLDFYHDCHTGCQRWTAVSPGDPPPTPDPQPSLPTKLGVVFPNPERDWRNRRGWVVELTYAQLAEEDYWGIDDLARRVETAVAQDLNVLVRVDYDQGQSIPPRDDYVALDNYLGYLRRLARDHRLQGVYGYVIGSGYNTDGGNAQAPQNRVTPLWYARVFNGHGASRDRSDNVAQTIHAENPAVRVLVGPVSPWRTDQGGERPYRIDVPWLNYFNTLVAAIDETAVAKAAAGVPHVAPDGFAVQAPGRPDAPELATGERADEPRIDLRRPEWDNAQAGFRVYRDWMAIVNAYPHTQGASLYITSSNTFIPGGADQPAQNYPAGWLTAALEVANREPQIAALCWFLDVFPHDDQWDFFSLTEPRGQMVNAAEEFDALLERSP